jgi:hypothetical protein
VANASVKAASGGALTANAIAHGGYGYDAGGTAKATVSSTGMSGSFSALADTNLGGYALAPFVSALASGPVSGTSSALAQARSGGSPFGFKASGQAVAMATAEPRADAGDAVLNANSKISSAFGAPPHDYFGIGELGGGYSAGGTGPETVTSQVSLSVQLGDLVSPGELALGLYNGDLVGTGVTSVTLTVKDTTSSTILLSRPGMTGAQALALFTNDGFGGLEVLTPADSTDTLQISLSVTTTKANSGFYGDFILGDPPASSSQSAAVHRMSTAMAAFAPAAGSLSAHAPANSGPADGALQLARPMGRFC